MSQDKAVEAAIPDPEVVVQAERRRFTAKYKLHILEEADRCNGAGELGALLRREGLYSSYLSRWRRQRDQGQLQALASKKRGRKGAAQGQQAEELAELRRENQRLQLRLQQAETVIEVQKKLSQLLGLTASETGKDASR
jgi:transposase-like protein